MPNITIPYKNPADNVIGAVIPEPPLALTLAYFGCIVNSMNANITPAIYEKIIVVIICFVLLCLYRNYSISGNTVNLTKCP